MYIKKRQSKNPRVAMINKGTMFLSKSVVCDNKK